MNRLNQLPADIKKKIYEYDDTYRKNYIRILNSIEFSFTMIYRHHVYDRGYTIRNYIEEWAIIPRYIIDGKIYGFYLRGNKRIKDNL